MANTRKILPLPIKLTFLNNLLKTNGLACIAEQMVVWNFGNLY